MRFTVSLFVLGLVFLASAPSSAQRVQSQPLKWNPYRDMGGSCVYGAKGEILHQPEGVTCRDRKSTVPLNSASDESTLVSLPPALRTEAESLLADHDHIAVELARLRTAIEKKRKKDALRSADQVIKELTKHLSREAEFFRMIAPPQEGAVR